MKIAYALMLIILSADSFAQTHQPDEPLRNQVEFGLGTPSIFQTADAIMDAMSPILPFGSGKAKSKEFSPVFYGQYGSSLNNHLQVLGGINYAFAREHYVDANGHYTDMHAYIYGLSVGANVYWFGQNRNVALYSGLQAGMGRVRYIITGPDARDEHMTAINWQFTAVGIKLGNPIGLHIETGFGCKGFINAGLSFRFR